MDKKELTEEQLAELTRLAELEHVRMDIQLAKHPRTAELAVEDAEKLPMNEQRRIIKARLKRTRRAERNRKLAS